MNDPVDPKQAALTKRETRARRIRRIRGGVAALGTSLVIAFSTVVMNRQSDVPTDTQVTSTTADSAQSTAATIPEVSVGSTGSGTSSQSTLASQSAPLTTSQS